MIKLALGVSTRRAGRPKWPDGAARAPVLAARPTLAGSGRIGAPVTLGPGTWLGAPAPDLAFEWRRNGALIPEATAPDYVPRAEDDRAALTCRVRAHNAAGSAVAETDPLSIRYSPPVADPPIPNSTYIQDSGVQILNVASNFQGSSLTFSVVGEGVSIDPETGELSIATETLREGVTVTVTAKNSGGEADQSFTLTIAAEPATPEEIAPTLVTPPELAGSGRIGEDVVVAPGEWGGTPAPEIALQWICGDKEIAGATGSSYMPGPEDDGHALTCRVIASNSAGELSAEPAPIMVTWEAPVVIDRLPDVTADQSAAPVTLEAAPTFAGGGLSFAVAGAGATIDAATGVVSIPTDLPLSGETVTVTASNSGGSVDASFLVTIEAVSDTGFPPLLPAGAWSVAEVRDAAPEGRRVISIDAGVVVPEGFELRWYSGREPGGIIADYNRVMTPGETYTTEGTLPVGITCHNVLYWRRIADDVWESAADDIVFEIVGLKKPVPVAPAVIVAPTLAGAGEIGREVSVDTGSWSGVPAPDLAVQWLRDGAEIDGASTALYVPGPEDDLTALTCRVTASNLVDTVTVETAALSVTYAAPQVVGELYDEVFDEGTGPESVATDQVFAGEGLSFAVAGAGATIDVATGVVSIPTDLPLSGETVTVTASNSGGLVEASFLVTIEAMSDAGFPPLLPAGAWSVAEMRDAAPEGRRVISIDAAVEVPESFELRWYSGTDAGGVAALSNRVMTPGETYTTKGTLATGAACHNMLYWRRVEDDAWEPAADEVVFEIVGLDDGTNEGGGKEEPAAAKNRSSVSQYGVTFNFDKAVPTGQFATGDWWVKSPVTIISITPAGKTVSGVPAGYGSRDMNGAMIDVGNGQGPGSRPQGADGYINPDEGTKKNFAYDPGLNVDPSRTRTSIVYKAGQEATVTKWVSNPTPARNDATDDMVHLTVVAAVPNAGAFRPAPSRSLKTSYWVSGALDMGRFPDLKPVSSMPAPTGIMSKVMRPHEHGYIVGFKQNLNANNNQQNPGRDYAGATADAALLLCTSALNAANKRRLLEYMVQLGIDIYGRAQEGGCWTDDGQLNLGRKVPLVIAAVALNDKGMKSFADGMNVDLWRQGYKSVSGPRVAKGSNDPVGPGQRNVGPIFQEDRTTFYCPNNIGALNDILKSKKTPYPASMAGKPEWGITATCRPNDNDSSLGTSYRSTHLYHQVACALAVHLIDGGRQVWNNPAFFDYVDSVRGWWRGRVGQNFGVNAPKVWHRDMWDAYRSKGGPLYPQLR